RVPRRQLVQVLSTGALISHTAGKPQLDGFCRLFWLCAGLGNFLRTRNKAKSAASTVRQTIVSRTTDRWMADERQSLRGRHTPPKQPQD
ncbi:hypothetical protein, partial [Hallella bergensis]|uniref:hypothetical protein n=1 Tax=Hallella bergensis TaxID=242750 RepID=UPI0023F48744